MIYNHFIKFNTRHLLNILFITLIHITFHLTNCDDDACTFINYIENELDDMDYCIESDVCKNNNKNFTISYINTPPFTTENMNNFGLREIEYLLRICCGACYKSHIKNWFTNLPMVHMSDIKKSDFLYPILARESTTKLYGVHYLPSYSLTKVLYVTKITDDTKLLEKIFELYPVIVLALLFALVAGFVAWLFETWMNEEEFKRPFLIGWFDGFWWSFISMTTVGYGDKSPRSVPARLFTVLWILIGLIVVAILTGEITGQIVQVNSPTPEEMAGKNVGVMHYRDFEAYVVAQHGGKVKRSYQYTDPVLDFIHLADSIRNGTIDGMAIEYESFFHIESLIEFNQKEVGDDLKKFLQSGITTTEQKYVGEKFSYGILVKDTLVYNYLKDYVAEARARNQFHFSVQHNVQKEKWEKRNSKMFGKGNSLLFSPESSYFINAVSVIGGLLGFIIIFGIMFEFARKKKVF